MAVIIKKNLVLKPFRQRTLLLKNLCGRIVVLSASLASGTDKVFGFSGIRRQPRSGPYRLFFNQPSDEEFDSQQEEGDYPPDADPTGDLPSLRRSLKDTIIRAVGHTLDIRDPEARL